MILLYFIITLLLVGSWLCFYPEMKYIYDKLIHSLTPSLPLSLTHLLSDLWNAYSVIFWDILQHILIYSGIVKKHF